MATIIERYAPQILGTISCYDRIVITGTVPGICYAGGMENYLRCRNIPFVDYPRFAKDSAILSTIICGKSQKKLA